VVHDFLVIYVNCFWYWVTTL